ncbi:MAG: hypothetical protein R2880_07955 [Deinococcales bacterium]
MMKELSPQAQYWFDISMAWTDKLWDEAKGLTLEPANRQHHSIRNSVWYALGLLYQGRDERAFKVIREVLRHQWDDVEKVYHGTFRRVVLEPDPPPNPTIWKDYDPNWREFICTVFLVMLKDFNLPEDLTADLWTAIYKASEGSFARKVEPAYTNIALMSAFLLDHAGKHFARQDWRKAAEALAQAVYALFREHNTFWEYNSPTYYGTDLYALSLWRAYGLTATFQDLGREMEEGLWQDIAIFYHAEMQNLCAPMIAVMVWT